MEICMTLFWCSFVKYFVHLSVTGSSRNAVKDDDRADLLWRPENDISSREGNVVFCNELWFLLNYALYFAYKLQ